MPTVSGGLDTTFQILAQTRNEAAVAVLLPALDSPQRAVQERAFKALLKRRSPMAQRELLHRWPELDERWRVLIADHPGRFSGTLRDALLGDDRSLCQNACAAVLEMREYDLIPTLVNAGEDRSNANADVASSTLLKLAELLYDELAAPRDYKQRRDPQLVRQHVLSVLQDSVTRYEQHRRREIMEAFVLLANRDNAVLRKLLQDPRGRSYLELINLLTNGQRPGVVRLLLNYLDDPHAPSSVVGVIAHRRDLVFLRHLLRKVGSEPSSPVRINLRRMETLSWVRQDKSILYTLDDAEQHAAVQLVMASGMNRLQAFELIRFILRNGNTGGRRAASEALAEFKGVEANQLALLALEDPDPRVQANIAGQLRARGLSGAMTRLIELIESPHRVVREAAQKSLDEFGFNRFLSAFEMLSEDVRVRTGQLVKKVDPQLVPLLSRELRSASRTRRLRALEITPYVQAAPDCEDTIIAMLQDEDHFIRAAAAHALMYCDTAETRAALESARGDRSVTVQETAEESLRYLDQNPAASGPTMPPADAFTLQEPTP